MKNIKVGDNVKIKLNKGYFWAGLDVGDVGEVVEVAENGDIHLVINDLGQDVEAELVDTYLEIIQDSIPKPIDFTKAQVFDPPILLAVSDYPDFPKERTCKELVFAVYPKFDAPIRTTSDIFDQPVSAYLYAREIKEDAFEEFWENEFNWNGFTILKKQIKIAWEAGVKHGKENK